MFGVPRAAPVLESQESFITTGAPRPTTTQTVAPVGPVALGPFFHERALSLNFQVSFINLNSLLISPLLLEDFGKPAAGTPFRQSRGVPIMKRLHLDLALSGVKLLKHDARWPNEDCF